MVPHSYVLRVEVRRVRVRVQQQPPRLATGFGPDKSAWYFMRCLASAYAS